MTFPNKPGTYSVSPWHDVDTTSAAAVQAAIAAGYPPVNTAHLGAIETQISVLSAFDRALIDALNARGLTVASLTAAKTAAAPASGKLNLYDCTSGALAPVLPKANLLPPGGRIGFKKVDGTANVLTVTCASGDHIDGTSGSTTIPIRTNNQIDILESDGTSVWSLVGGRLALPSLDSRYAQSVNALRSTAFGSAQHEDGTTYTYPNRLTFAALNAPPTAVPAAPKGADVCAHMYNDFGLEKTASSSSQANGSYTWYDWRWNFVTNTGDGVTTYGYDPQRHPLIGYYQGDNVNVLGWMAYWLAEAGVNVVSITTPSGFSKNGGNWANSSDPYYWIYQLMNNVPNFGALQFMLWTGSNASTVATTTSIQARDDEVVAMYAAYPNAYSYSENGKTYAVVFCWDLESVRGVFDGFGSSWPNTKAYLKALAAKFQAVGYDGVMMLARNAGSVWSENDPTLVTAGCIVLSATYEGRYASDAVYNGMVGSNYTAPGGVSVPITSGYQAYAATCAFPTDARAIPNVCTGAKSQYPHPTGWTAGGTTPALFGQALRRGVDSIYNNRQRQIITIYNVSEWAEGGPGLVPTVADGFGYLDAIRSLPTRGVHVTPNATSSGGNTPKVTVFNAGTGQTFTKTSWSTVATVTCIGPGGGGGGGAQVGSGSANSGGGSGAGGAYSQRTIQTSALGTTETVNVGTGGAGGAAAASATTAGSDGSPGSGVTTFGNHLRSGFGLGGTGGQVSTASTGGLTGGTGQLAGAIGVGCQNGAAGVSGLAASGAPSGGSGAGNATTPVVQNGGTGGASNQNGITQGLPGTSGTPNGGNGASGATGEATPGTGGGGGASGGASAAGGSGGIGGRGAGGGGGGSSVNGQTPGAGGKGGDGLCVIVEF